TGQGGLDLAFEQEATPSADALLASIKVTVRPRVLRASEAEVAAHMARLDALDKAAGTSIWRKMEA
ncbi:MAG TPA: DNA polymerase III subunit epsilon, partial [Luteibacter sp.]|nr:DNA polymerase III subunit epsilon [Luteibacter sp.]